MSRHIYRRTPPGVPRRSWPRLRPHREYDPRYDVLMECQRCKRKVGEGPLKALRIWRVRHQLERIGWNGYRPSKVVDGKIVEDASRIAQAAPDAYSFAVVECADTQECRAYVESKERKRREAQERRRPRLPHADAPPGTCKWCGEEIQFDETVKGWKRCRQRGYHRGDAMELGDRNCLLPAMIWLDPKRATQALLRRQEGRCTECGGEIAELTDRVLYDDLQPGDQPHWWPTRSIDIDHRKPVVDGGENVLDNLQAICNTPCHKAKTAREAKARAKARKAALPPPEPERNPGQLEIA